jgi:hypothetical protein
VTRERIDLACAAAWAVAVAFSFAVWAVVGLAIYYLLGGAIV